MAPKQDTINLESDNRFTSTSPNAIKNDFGVAVQAQPYKTLPLATAQSEISELSGIPVIDRAKVIQTAQRIYPIVESRLKPYPILSTKRLPAICLTSAAMCPNNTEEVVIEMTIFSMILIGIDDLIDDHSKHQLNTNQAHQLLKIWENIVKAAGESPVETSETSSTTLAGFSRLAPENQVTKALANFCQKLKTSPYAQDYYEFFTLRFSLLMTSMSLELDWQDNFRLHKSYPSYHDYLLNGRESIEAPTLMSALLIIGGPARTQLNTSTANSLTQPRLTSQLEELLFSCGSSIRLTNDIGGFERELVEQKPNSVSILLHQQKKLWTAKSDEKIEQIFLKNVKDAVLREADNYQLQLEKQVNRLPEALASWGDSVLRVTSFCRDFSLAREFYTLSLEMLDKLKSNLN